MPKATYHLDKQPIPKGCRIFFDRLAVAGLFARKPAAIKFCSSGDPRIQLKPDPRNLHDPHAIQVVGSWNGWFGRKHALLGFVPAEEAALIAEHDLVNQIQPRLLKTYLGTDDYVEVLFQIIGPKESYQLIRDQHKNG